MIISFSVENFRSFNTEATINLVASNRFADHHDSHAVPIPRSDQRVLRAGVLYGANGAGKSNLFRALAYMQRMVLRPRSPDSGTDRDPFLLDMSATRPSTFDLTFALEKKTYRYGFSVDDHRIMEEWLSEMDGNREISVFERTTEPGGKVNVESKYLKDQGGKLAAMATVGGPQNQTFLATLNNTLDASDLGSEIGKVLDWFSSGLVLISPDASFRSLGGYMMENQDFKDFASRFLSASSTGVERLAVGKEELTEEQARKFVSEDKFSRLQSGGLNAIVLAPGMEIRVERKDGVRYYLINITADHQTPQGSVISLGLEEESDGTRRLLNLMPVLFRLRHSGGCFFIDEIDRSMHPLLAWKFIEFFLKSCPGDQRQVIVTTHECNLLDLELVRRDEIWFAEKNLKGATELFSLADFKVRKDLSIQKHYLQGRFGAIPFLGDIDRLIQKGEDDCEP